MIEKTSVYHQSKTHYAYCYDNDTLHIKLKTKRDNIQKVILYGGDPFIIGKSNADNQWQYLSYEMVKYQSSSLYDYWFLAVQPPFHRFSYLFKLISEDEIWWYSEKGFELEPNLKSTKGTFNFPWMNQKDILKYPQWIKNTIWYQIFPERFNRSEHYHSSRPILPWNSTDPTPTNFFGGNLQGIIEKLDYLTKLGINALYLNPIFIAPSNHKYDTTDYYQVDNDFGTNQIFQSFITHCHQRNIKVMLDGVFNHVSWEHFAWQDVLVHQEQSKYRDWFHIRKFPIPTTIDVENELTYDTFGFVPQMPKLNTENKEVQKYLLDIAKFWIKQYDIDAWRLDVANEIDHHFWRLFRTTVNQQKETYLLAETWNIALPWLNGDQFDGAMNYPLMDLIYEYFVEQKTSLQTFSDRLKELIFTYPNHVFSALYNCLDSHDTPRLLTCVNNNIALFKLAYLFLFLAPGAPAIYYGDEIGLDGENDPMDRKCMIWNETEWNHDIWKFMKSLIKMRTENSLLLSAGSYHFIDDQNLLIFQRVHNNDNILVIINNNLQKRKYDLSNLTNKRNDLLTNITYDDVIEINPYSSIIL